MPPLPNSGDEKSDSGQSFDPHTEYEDEVEFTCVVRITPGETSVFTMEQMCEHIQTHLGLDKCLVVREYSIKGVLHYHIVAATNDIDHDMRYTFTALIDEMFPKKDRKRGFGNKQWNFQMSDTPQEGMMYALKHKGERWFFGYAEEYIQEMEAKSYVKPERSGFLKDLDALSKKFGESDMTLEEYMTEFIILKSKYGQMVNLQHAYQYALSATIKRDPNSAIDFVQDFVRRFQ